MTVPKTLRSFRIAFVGLPAFGLAFFIAWIRLRHLGYTEMGPDQALLLTTALEWVHGGPLPLASMKLSFGIFGPPLIEYLYAVPLYLNESVMGVLWWTALANLAGLFIAWWATSRVFGRRAAWWAALLYGVSPWAVYYSRLIWLPTFVPVFSALTYACVLLYFTVSPRPAYLALAVLCLAAAAQVHPTAVALGIVVLIACACYPRLLKPRPLLVGAALALLSFAPYLLYQFRSGFADWQALRAGLNRPAEVSPASLLILFDLIQSKGVYPTLGSASRLWQSRDLPWLHADPIVAGLLALAVVAGLASILAHKRARPDCALPPPLTGRLVLLLWIALPVIAFVRHTHPLQNYYFLHFFPAPFVLIAVLAEQARQWLLRRTAALGRAGPWLAGLAFAPLALVAFQQARLDVIGQNLLAAGTSGQQRVVDVQQAIDRAKRLMADRTGCQFVVLSEGAGYESSRFALLREFVGPVRVRFVQAGAGRLLPFPCGVYFSVTDDPQVRAWLEGHTSPLPEHTVITPEQTWTFHELTSTDREVALAGMLLDRPLGSWADGVELIDFALEGDPTPGGSLGIVSTWALSAPGQAHPLHFGNYLMSGGSVAAQWDGTGVDSTQGQPGDVLQTKFVLPLPPDLHPGEYSLVVARYLWPELTKIPIDGEGEVLALDLLTVR